MNTLRRLVSVLLAAALALPAGSTPPAPAHAQPYPDQVNAIGYLNGNHWGIRTFIETAIPQVRDGGISWVRSAAQYNPAGGQNDFVEIGWVVSAQSSTPIVSVTSHDPSMPADQYLSLTYPYYPSVGSTHVYRVYLNNNTGLWDTYYDDVYVTSRPMNDLYQTTRIFSGGEASSSANAIGVSGCLYNQYGAGATQTFYPWPSFLPQVDAGYTVHGLSAYGYGPNSWQVYGNN